MNSKTTLKKMFSNKKLLVSLAMLLIVLITLTISTYTWFFKGGTLLTIEFQTGYVEMGVSLYEGIDFDQDGVLDVDIEKSGSAYEPKFQLIQAGAGQANPITISGVPNEEQVLTLPNIVIEDLYPGQVYTYKLEMINQGDIDSAIALSLDSYNNIGNAIDMKEVMSVEAYAFGTEGIPLAELRESEPYTDIEQGKYLLCGWEVGSPCLVLSGLPFVEIDELDINGNPLKKATLILKFKFEELELVGPALAAQGITRSDFNVYMGGSFKIPDLRVKIYSID